MWREIELIRECIADLDTWGGDRQGVAQRVRDRLAVVEGIARARQKALSEANSLLDFVDAEDSPRQLENVEWRSIGAVSDPLPGLEFTVKRDDS